MIVGINIDYFLNRINRIVFVMDMLGVSCETGTQFLKYYVDEIPDINSCHIEYYMVNCS